MHYIEEEPGMKIYKILDISKSNGSAPKKMYFTYLLAHV